MIKRILSLFLCFSVILSMSITCFAAANTSPWLDSANQTFEPVPSQVVLEAYARAMFPDTANAADAFQKWIVDTYGKSTVTDKEAETESLKCKIVNEVVDTVPYQPLYEVTNVFDTPVKVNQWAYIKIKYCIGWDISTSSGEYDYATIKVPYSQSKLYISSSASSSDIDAYLAFLGLNFSDIKFLDYSKVPSSSYMWRYGDFYNSAFRVHPNSVPSRITLNPYWQYSNILVSGDSRTGFSVPYMTFAPLPGYVYKESDGTYRFLSNLWLEKDSGSTFSFNFNGYLSSPSSFEVLSITPFHFGGGEASRGGGAGRFDNKIRFQDPVTKKVTDTDFVDESTKKITLANNTTYDISGWTYDYSTRTYTATTVDNSTNITVIYGDKNVTTNTVNNITGSTETFNYNYVTVVDTPPPASSSTAPPPASSSTAPPPASSSTSPPPASSSMPTTPDGGGGGSSGTDWLGKLLKSLLDGFLKLLNSVVGGVVDVIVGLVTKLVDGITTIINSLFNILKQFLTFDSEFGKFFGSFFGWLPPEIIVLITGGISIMIALAIIKFLRK